MKTLLRLSALFAVLALVAWAAGAQTASIDMGPFSGGRLVTPIGPRTYPVPDPGPTYPLSGYFVYQPDPACPTVGSMLPDSARTICQRAKAIEYLIQEVQSGRLTPGPAWKDCTYRSDPAWPYCVEFSIKAHVPEIRFGMSPVWVRGVIGTAPFEGCAAGVAYSDWVRVSIADLPRSYLLVSHETTNTLLFYFLDRRDLADGYVCNEAVSYARSACGGF